MEYCCATALPQLIGGLADEKIRWAESVDEADKALVAVTGDVVISSGSVAYLGAFTVSVCYIVVVYTYDCTHDHRESIVLIL